MSDQDNGNQPVETQSSQAVESNGSQESSQSAPIAPELLTSGQKQALTQEIKSAQSKGETKEQIQKRIEKFHLKVNGKDYVRELDLNDKDAITRTLQRDLAGQQAMQKAAEFERAQQQRLEKLSKNPFAIFEEAKELGVDPKELAYYYLQQQVQEAEKSPEVKAQEELQRKFEESEKKRAELEERQKNMEFQALKQQQAAAIEEEILDLINSDDELEYTPKVVKEIINTLVMFDKMGYKDIGIKDVIPTVKHKLEREMNALFDSYANKGNYKMMEKLIGRKNFDSWRKSIVEKAKDNPTTIASKVPKVATPQEKQNKPKSKITQEEFLRRLSKNK